MVDEHAYPAVSAAEASLPKPEPLLVVLHSIAGRLSGGAALINTIGLAMEQPQEVERHGDAAAGAALAEDDKQQPDGIRRSGLHLFAGRIHFKGEDNDLLINSAEPLVVSLDSGHDTFEEWAAARARPPAHGRAKRGRVSLYLR